MTGVNRLSLAIAIMPEIEEVWKLIEAYQETKTNSTTYSGMTFPWKSFLPVLKITSSSHVEG